MASLVGVLKFREVYNAVFRKANFLSARYQSSFLNGKTLRIGCASGFWGDTATSVPQLVMLGQLDFLVFDYLSEITMSLLVAMRRKYPDLGYTPDFIMAAMMPHLAEIKRQGIRVISNAGGINPHACAKALKEAASKQDINLHIAVVTGDDLIPQKEEIEKAGYKDMTSGLPFPKTINSMNAYLGAGPISAALDMGADVVITGRCTDSALALAPLLHTFKWKLNNWNKLAAGSLAGHLIECGAQSTGGIFTDWHQVPEWLLVPMADRLTLEQRRVVASLMEVVQSATEVHRRFAERFPDRQPPTRLTIYCIYQKFVATGSVRDNYHGNAGRPRSGRSEVNIATVQEAILRSPSKLTRRCSLETGIPQRTVNRILSKDLGM